MGVYVCIINMGVYNKQRNYLAMCVQVLVNKLLTW